MLDIAGETNETPEKPIFRRAMSQAGLEIKQFTRYFATYKQICMGI
ncbi:hypothetical protein SBDP1_1160020 [Syntrophobacter sp. SbD1]|nr:hypothetical protein SBDP1_1160020 [Syntrophobacter sp. SbD1]